MAIDSDHATLEDLVEGALLSKFGYSKEIAITTSQGDSIYDNDFQDNLPEKLSKLNIKDQTFITIVDEDDQGKDPRINLELLVVQR